VDATLCPLCPLFWLCGALSPETDVDKANRQNAALRAENHELRQRMADRGIDAGGSIYVKGQDCKP
jgi:hypothetical protein